jgi:serine/threonine-protein kinase
VLVHAAEVRAEGPRRRYREHALALAAIRHPRVLPVVDVVGDAERELVVAELPVGGTIDDAAKRAGGRLAAAEALRIAHGALAGVAALPASLPRRVPLAGKDEGTYWHVSVGPDAIVLDRGLEPRLSVLGAVDWHSLTCARGRGWELPAPIELLAPEQLRGIAFVQMPDAAPKGDVYVIGALLYRELARGASPFRLRTGARDQPFERIRAVLEDEPIPLREHAPGLPPVVSDVVARLMAKDWTRRPGPREAVALLDPLVRGFDEATAIWP